MKPNRLWKTTAAVSAIVVTATLATPACAQSAGALTPNMRGLHLSTDLVGRLFFSADSLTSGTTARAGRVATFGVGWGHSERSSTLLTVAFAQPPRLDGTDFVLFQAEIGARYSFKARTISHVALVPFVQVGGARRSLTDQESVPARWLEGWSATAAAGGQLFVTPKVAFSVTAAYSQGTFRWLYEEGGPTVDIRDPARAVTVTTGVAYHPGRTKP